jgi:hypothetical protein
MSVMGFQTTQPVKLDVGWKCMEVRVMRDGIDLKYGHHSKLTRFSFE